MKACRKAGIPLRSERTFYVSKINIYCIEEAGCFLKLLPSYSPDFNPIEEWWATL